MNKNKVIIIGAGPSGIAAAIQLKRHNIEPILLEQSEIGGLLRNANLVENYPGFPNGITGPDLIALFKRQLQNTGIQVSQETVVEISYAQNLFVTQTNQREIVTNYAVIAIGTIPKTISDLPIADGIKDRIHYEVYPILGETGKKIAIIGAGDAAFDYALNLVQNNRVLILNRGSNTRCLPLLFERAQNTNNIEYITNIKIRNITNTDDQLALTCNHNNEIITIECNYLLIAAGRDPNFGIIGNSLKVKTDELIRNRKLYLIGDVVNDRFRQTAICVGNGVRAAMEIAHDMKRNPS